MANFNKVIKLAVALIIIAVIFPIALGLIGNAGNVVVNATSGDTLADVIDPTVLTLLVVLLPIIAIISVVMMFLPKGKT
jgi:hypothetical protein